MSREMRSCVVCGYEWLSGKEPQRCANTECRARGWKGGDNGAGVKRVAGGTVPEGVERSVGVGEARESGDLRAEGAGEHREVRRPKAGANASDKPLSSSEQMRQWRESRR